MLLTDLFTQNAKGLSPQARVPLQNGVSAWLVPEPTAFMKLVEHLLYAEGFDPDAAFAGGDPSRAGFLFEHPAGVKHRLLRDLRSGACQLGRMENGAVTPLAGSGADVAAMLRAQFKLPAHDWFLYVLWLRPQRFPSQRRVLAGASKKPQRVLREQTVVEAELAAMAEKKSSGVDVEALEFELDGLQKQRFRYDDLIVRRQKLLSEVDRVKRTANNSTAMQAVPDDFAQRVAAWNKVDKKLRDEQAKVLDELRVLDEQSEPRAPLPLQRDAKFIGGVVGGLVLLGAAAFLPGNLRLLGLLDVLPFGLASIQSFGWIADLETRDVYLHRRQLLRDLDERYVARIEKAQVPIQQVLKRAGLPMDELLEALQNRGAADVHVRHAEDALKAFEQGEGAELANAEYQRLVERCSEIETLLLSTSVGAGQGNQAQRKRELEDELAQIVAKAQTQPTIPVTDEPLGTVDPTGERGLLLVVAEVLGLSPDEAAGRLVEVGLRYLQKLGFPDVSSLDVQVTGEVSLDGKTLSDMTNQQADLAHLALSFAAYELTGSLIGAPLWAEGLSQMNLLPGDSLFAYLQALTPHGQLICVEHTGTGLPPGVQVHSLV